jgi:hypothetical protein
MKREMLAGMVALFVGGSALPAAATVDVLMDINVPYSELQSGDVCFMKTKMWAVIGIPPGSAMNGTFRPVYVFQEQNSAAFPYVNINLLATNPKVGVTYVSDRWVGSTLEYKMKVDLTALAQKNGPTLEGRTRTVTVGKLAVLAMARNLSQMSRGNYKLWIDFIGIPSQTGIPGTRLYATTSYPYGDKSPLVLNYTRELLNRSNSCR